MPKDKLIYLGDCIRSKRKECNLTQQELADQCDLAVKTIQDIEKGRKNPSYITLSLLIERLGISPNSLFPAMTTIKNELAEHVIGKLQACSEENQAILLHTMDFLSEQLLTSQHKPESKDSD